MDRVWAPWRSVYIGKDMGSECIFCDKLHASDDESNYVVARGEKVFVIMNIFPYTNGHLLVAPKRHVGDLEELDQEESLELFQMTQRMVGVVRKAFNYPHGFNIGINLGKVAGAGIPGHFHIHIVPRWEGDHNFMPVLGDVRVISEGLDDTYRKLQKAMQE